MLNILNVITNNQENLTDTKNTEEKQEELKVVEKLFDEKLESEKKNYLKNKEKNIILEIKKAVIDC